MYRGTLEEALRQKPKSLETLERVRNMYLRQMEKMPKVELLKMHAFFTDKEREADEHEKMLTEAKGMYPRLITAELITFKVRLLDLWKGLREEIERRLR